MKLQARFAAVSQRNGGRRKRGVRRALYIFGVASFFAQNRFALLRRAL
jgi:hypothetical protein